MAERQSRTAEMIAARLAEDADLGTIGSLSRLSGGANNQVFEVQTEAGPAILKRYFTHPNDRRDRFGAETAFLRHAERCGVDAVPKLLAASKADRACLMTKLPGQAVTAVDEPAVEAAIRLVEQLQTVRPDPPLAMGSEAAFSIEQHLETVDGRLGRLAEAIGRASDASPGVAPFLHGEVIPEWSTQRAGVLEKASQRDLNPSEEILPPDRLASPSDFGFHNALQTEDGRLGFHDFEYAGVDDPAKLVGDFFHQVRVPVPNRHFPRVRDRVAALTGRPVETAKRIELLFPVYAFKWIAIVLNHFLEDGAARRQFSGADLADADTRQLSKARALLTGLEADEPATNTKGEAQA